MLISLELVIKTKCMIFQKLTTLNYNSVLVDINNYIIAIIELVNSKPADLFISTISVAKSHCRHFGGDGGRRSMALIVINQVLLLVTN